jgi:hypothetical protein
MATYISSDGCPDQVVPNISLFNPYLLNTDNWVQTMLDFGAQYAVIVAKVRIRLSFECLDFLIIIAWMWIFDGSVGCKVSFESIWRNYFI